MKKTFKHPKFTAVFTDDDGYFSLTGDCNSSSGAVGNRIADIDDRFAFLDKMHLSNRETGAPMHAWENADYYFDRGEIITLKRHLRTTKKLFNEYCETKTQINRTYALLKDITGAHKNVENLKYILESIKEEIKSLWIDDASDVYDLIDDIQSNLCDEFVSPYDIYGELISDEYEEIENLGEPNKAIALAMHLDVDVLDIEEESKNYYCGCGKTYLVVNDGEGDDLWDEDLDNYIDECLEIPEEMINYFDRDAWKRDARMDGRAHSLARYDGNEYNETVDGVCYYIYRN